MEEQKIIILKEKFKKYMNKRDRESLQEKLETADEEAFVYLANKHLKRTLTTTLLSIFLPGWSAGRLYLGNYRFASLVIALSCLMIFLETLILNSSLTLTPKLILLFLIGIADLIWIIFEIFRTRVVCHRQNYATVCDYLKKKSKHKN